MGLVTCEDLSARTHVSAFSVPSQGGRCHQVSWGAGASEAGLLPGHGDIWPGTRCPHGCLQGTTARSGSEGKRTGPRRACLSWKMAPGSPKASGLGRRRRALWGERVRTEGWGKAWVAQKRTGWDGSQKRSVPRDLSTLTGLCSEPCAPRTCKHSPGDVSPEVH